MDTKEPAAWANLPNAAHIDRVVAHARAHPDKWGAAWGAAWDPARGAARGAAQGAARDAAWDAARYAAWDAARHAARYAVRGAAWSAARDAAGGSCAALVAWDEAGELMDKPVSMLKFLAQEEVHAAVLLLPAAIAMEGSTT